MTRAPRGRCASCAAYFLLNDGYDVLTFEPLRIVSDTIFADGFQP